MLTVPLPSPRVHAPESATLSGGGHAPADADSFLEWAQVQNAQEVVDDSLRNSVSALMSRLPVGYSYSIHAVRGVTVHRDGTTAFRSHFSASATRGNFVIGTGDTAEQAVEALLAKLTSNAA